MKKLEKRRIENTIIYIVLGIYTIEAIFEYKFQTTFALYKVGYNITQIIVGLIMILAFYKIINNINERDETKILTLCVITSLINVVTNCSLNGILMIVIIFQLIISFDTKSIESRISLLLGIVFIIKIIALLINIDVIKLNSSFIKNSNGFLIDICLCCIICVEILIHHLKEKIIVKRMTVCICFVICILIPIKMAYSLFTHITKEIDKYSYFYLLDSNDESKALTNENGELVMDDFKGMKNQYFKVEETEGNLYYLKTSNGEVLDVAGQIFEEETPIILWNKTGNTNQLWKIEKDNKYIMLSAFNTCLHAVIHDGRLVLSENQEDNVWFKCANINDYNTIIGKFLYNNSLAMFVLYMIIVFGLIIYGGLFARQYEGDKKESEKNF